MRGTHTRPTETTEFIVRNTRAEDGDGVHETIALANGERLYSDSRCMDAGAVAEQLERFPEGQFVAVVREDGKEKVIGAATTMRTGRSPFEFPLRWLEMIGSYGLANHDPSGNWLYGVEMAVRPDYQRRGVATALYKVRLALVEKLGLEGWYAGGMLMGYHRYRDQMSVREYARKVISGKLEDPTVTMQMHRGLKPRGFIEEYAISQRAGNGAVMLVWQPPARRQARRPARPLGQQPGLRP